MTDCPHHGDLCELVKCERIPYNCDEKALWYVSFGDPDLNPHKQDMPRCPEHVAAAMSYSQENTVTRIPKRDHGE